MKIKTLIPMLVFVCAIGMAFTTADLKEEPKVAYDYILDNGTWQAVPEQDCQGEGQVCTVQMGQNGPVYELYDEKFDTDPKPSSSSDPIVINPNL